MLDTEDIQILSQILELQDELVSRLEYAFKNNDDQKMSKSTEEILRNQIKITQILK